MSRNPRRVAARALLILALGSPAGVGVAGAATPEPAVSPPVPTLAWTACDPGFECAKAPVPLDYDDPTGTTIELALIRVKATSPSARIGSLFVNPGGPGGSGVDIVRNAAASSFAGLNERFDIVGFDPRGVGASGNVVCLTDAERQVVGSFTPSSDEENFFFRIAVKAFEQFRCPINNPILPHVSTANVARDLDVLRQAVGDDKLSYIGFSYGTYLGATYASLFPGKARALALDGAVDPQRFANDPYGQWLGYAAGFEQSLGRFFTLCEQIDGCPLAPGGAARNYDRIVNELNATPLVTTIAGVQVPVTGAELRSLTFLFLYQRQTWGIIAEVANELDQGSTTLLDLIVGQLSSDGGGPSNALQAILAADQPWPTDVAEALAYNEWEASASPRLADVNGLDALDFAFWRADDEDYFNGPFVNPADAAPVLVIGTTFDPATPYDGSLAMTAQLGNARLLTSDGDGHTAFGRSGPCIDDAVKAFLFELTLPAEGAVCVQDPGYQPGAPAAAPEVTTPAAQIGTLDQTGLALWRSGLQRSAFVR